MSKRMFSISAALGLTVALASSSFAAGAFRADISCSGETKRGAVSIGRKGNLDGKVKDPTLPSGAYDCTLTCDETTRAASNCGFVIPNTDVLTIAVAGFAGGTSFVCTHPRFDIVHQSSAFSCSNVYEFTVPQN